MHEKFHYATLEALRARAEELNAFIPLSEELDSLANPIAIGERTLHNRLATQAMEGSDGTETGAPGELTYRRYERFALGGAALIWFEAVATAPEVRASAHQLYLTQNNLDDFKRLVERTKEVGFKKNGYAPLIIMQATNSGRYSKPHGFPEPLIAYNNPLFEETPIDSSRILTDEQLDSYAEKYTLTAKLAQQAGFDGIDVKCCHRYLASELLSAYERAGAYGGSFENRTRFVLNCHRAAKAGAVGDFIFTTRLNVYDGFPYPYGFGVRTDGSLDVDLTEAKRLIEILQYEIGVPLINITMGNPYKNPHVNRPYDAGNYVPDEHPLTGVSRMMKGLAEIQEAFPTLPVMGSGFSYPRDFSANLAAGMVSGGHVAIAGFGRMAFANPDFANQILREGGLDANKVCVTCGGCAKLLRAGQPAGCVIRDRSVYKAIK